MPSLETRNLYIFGIIEESNAYPRNRKGIPSYTCLEKAAKNINIFSSKIRKKFIRYNKPIFTCLVDQQQAFDNVELNDIGICPTKQGHN